MRIVWMVVGAALVLVVLAFVVQNTAPVTVSLFTGSFTAPFALVAVAVYLLGMATGSSLFAALRRSYRESRRHPGDD